MFSGGKTWLGACRCIPCSALDVGRCRVNPGWRRDFSSLEQKPGSAPDSGERTRGRARRRLQQTPAQPQESHGGTRRVCHFAATALCQARDQVALPCRALDVSPRSGAVWRSSLPRLSVRCARGANSGYRAPNVSHVEEIACAAAVDCLALFLLPAVSDF